MSQRPDQPPVEDVIEIQQLLARYAVGMTKDDVDAVMEVFTPDGTYSAFGDTYAAGRLPDAGRRRAQGPLHGRAAGARARRRHRHRPAAAVLRRPEDPRHAHRLLHRHLPPHGRRLAAAHPVDDVPAQERRPRLRAGPRPDPSRSPPPVDRRRATPPWSSTSSGPSLDALARRARRRARARPRRASARSTSRWRSCPRSSGSPTTPAGCAGAGPSASAGSAARRCCGPTSARRSPSRDLVEPGLYSMTEVLAPTMIDYAPPELAATMVPRLLRGDETWCQGFSEPGTGSNLAALSCRATRTDDGWRVTGQKVWTSLAQYAQRCVLLTRTGTPESAHRGITALFVDMDTPGHHRATDRDHARRARVLRGLLRRRRRAVRPHARRRGPGLVGGHGPAAVRAQHGAVAPGRLPAPAAPAAARRGARRRARPGAPRRGDPAPLRVPGPLAGHAAPAGRRRAPRARRPRSTRCWWPRPSRPCSTSSPTAWPPSVTIGDDPTSERWRTEFLYSRAATIYGGSAEIQRNIIARRLLDLGSDR